MNRLPNLYHVTANEAVLAKCLAVLGCAKASVEKIEDGPAFGFHLRSNDYRPGPTPDSAVELARQLLDRLNAGTIRIPAPLEHGYRPGYEIRSDHKGDVVLLAAGVRPAPETKYMVRSDPRYAEEASCE